MPIKDKLLPSSFIRPINRSLPFPKRLLTAAMALTIGLEADHHPAIQLPHFPDQTPNQLSGETEPRSFKDPNFFINRSLQNPQEFATVAAYGTPVTPGWGSLAFGLHAENSDPWQNFLEIFEYNSSLISPNRQVHGHADLVLFYDNVFVGDSVSFAQKLFDHGFTASFNLRPPGNFSIEDLNLLVEKILTGTATYQDGSPVVTKEFLSRTRIPIFFDLEEMLRGMYPEGIPAAEFNRVLATVDKLTQDLGYESVIGIYDRGRGQSDMFDDASQLILPDQVFTIFSGFVPSGIDNMSADQIKLLGALEIADDYNDTNTAIMFFLHHYLHSTTIDNFSYEQAKAIANHPRVGFILQQ